MDISTVLSMTQALAEQNRLRALMALGRCELCVCDLIELLGLAPSTVSKHMAILREAGLVLSRKQGRWNYYRLPGEDASPPVRSLIAWAFESLADASQIKNDAATLERIRANKAHDQCAP